MKRERNMRHCSMLRSPKKEEQQLVPESCQNIENLENIKGFFGINNFNANNVEEEAQHYSKLEDHFWGINNHNNNSEEHKFFGWECLSSSWENEEIVPNHQENKDESFNNINIIGDIINDNNNGDYKREEEELGSFNENNSVSVMEETKASLNLNLNYEEVLEAWSNRGSLWAHNNHHHASFSISNNHYGEVPNLEDERKRRETSVLRYKEKRQNRLFSKKIRYEVRKFNADKRPRLKGRFVKRT